MFSPLVVLLLVRKLVYNLLLLYQLLKLSIWLFLNLVKKPFNLEVYILSFVEMILELLY
jgi:hypothetical protein